MTKVETTMNRGKGGQRKADRKGERDEKRKGAVGDEIWKFEIIRD